MRRGGIIQVATNGVVRDAKGAFDYALGTPKRDTVVGSNGVHGFTETPQVPFIEGAITDSADLDLKALFVLEDATVTLVLANGKTIVLRNAWYAGEGTANTEQGEVAVRFEGLSAEEV